MLLFFFNDSATTEIYTLSLHDALPIYPVPGLAPEDAGRDSRRACVAHGRGSTLPHESVRSIPIRGNRSEEHTSELQSHVNLVCRLLLEKKKKTNRKRTLKTRKDKEQYY